MTPAESIAKLYGFYTRTVAHLGVSGWQSVPEDATVLGVVPQECGLQDGSSGVHYNDTLEGPGQVDAASSALSVAGFWKTLGLNADAGKPTNPNDPQLVATGFDSEINARYTVDAKGSTISLVTVCVPGDIDQIIERVIKHREGQSASSTPPAG